MTGSRADALRRLRRALLANAALSGGAGLVALARARPVASLAGVAPVWPAVIGAALAGYATCLLWLARAGSDERVVSWAPSATAADAAWVAGAVLVSAAAPLAAAGRAMLLASAVAVGAVAWRQARWTSASRRRDAAPAAAVSGP